MSEDCFLVERYESDLEEDDEGEQVILMLTERFLKEKNTDGEVCWCIYGCIRLCIFF